jgi:Holliday junction resolvase RusA-like endonuclease
MFKEFIKRQCVKEKIRGPYRVNIYIDTYKDIDNSIKAVIDALAESGVIDNDRNVHQLFVSKGVIGRGKPENIMVAVETI